MCENSSAVLSGFKKTDRGITYFDKHRLDCNSFSCPECAPKKASKVKERVFTGDLFKNANNLDKYGSKFVTLTLPGKEYREKHTPGQGLGDLNSNFHKLTTSLRRIYGKVDYFRVYEPHKDGFPHFHVLFVGPGIRPKSFKDTLERLWCDLYGMGFVKVNIIRGFEHGIRYLTKYLTKGLEPIKKYQRIFSSSRGALAPVIKGKKVVWLGFRHVNFDYGSTFSGTVYNIPMKEILKIIPNFHELMFQGYGDIEELKEIIVEYNAMS